MTPVELVKAILTLAGIGFQTGQYSGGYVICIHEEVGRHNNGGKRFSVMFDQWGKRVTSYSDR